MLYNKVYLQNTATIEFTAECSLPVTRSQGLFLVTFVDLLYNDAVFNCALILGLDEAGYVWW
jgi:hypothetical protein